MKKQTFILLIGLSPMLCIAQSVEPSVIGGAGDFYTSTNSQLSFTVGEMMVETVSSTNSIITQGFQQPDELPDAIDENLPNNVQVTMYPNPTRDRLVVEVENNDQPLELMLFDMNGKQVMSKQMPATNNREEMNLVDFANGNYLLNIVSKDNKYSASYKIQKLK